MIKKNKLITKCLISLLSIFSAPVWAAGIGSDTNPSSIATTFTATYLPVPTLLATRTPYGGLLCSLSAGSTGSFVAASAKWRTPNIAGTITTGGYTYEIQRTNIPGIGAIARTSATYSLSNSPSVPALKVVGSEYVDLSASLGSNAQSVYFGNKYWGLVTIPGEVFVPGVYSLGQAETMVDVWCKSSNSSNDAHGGGYLSGQVVINSPTCYFGPDISSVTTLNLGEYQWSSLRNLSTGSNFGSASKTLTMECQPGSWPKLTVSDKNNNNNNSNIISLTNPNATSTAQGVGVQLFINNQAIPQQLATRVNLTPSKLTSVQTINLPLEFKYVKTRDTLSTGEANAIVDLTFTYD